MRKRIIQLLNIRGDEVALVSNLLLLQLFQGAGIAIFNIVAFSLFLGQFEVRKLPEVYIFSAVLLWISGWVYTRLEHAIPLKKLAPAVIAFIALSVLLFRLNLFFFNSAGLIFLMFSWFYVIYLLGNLEFWGISATLFDLRQSKRLFGTIGAGDLAKLVGYSIVPLLMKTIGSQNTLFVSLACFIIAFAFFWRLRASGHLDIEVKPAHHHTKHHGGGHRETVRVKELFEAFFGNRMIAIVAGLSFIVLTCVTLISFSFYVEVKHESHSNEQLASFIAMFYAGGGLLALIIRLIFTGRLANFLGTKVMLLISPSIIFLFLLLIACLPLFHHTEHAVLYIFGSLAIITEVLKSSLQDPVFLTLMQPLSPHLKLKSHSVVKGVLDPFALAFTGTVLVIMLQISEKVNLEIISIILLVLVVVWVIMVFLVDKEYMATLVTALNKRYSIGQEISLTGEKTREILQSKINSTEKGEAIYALRLIEKHYTDESADLVVQALQNPQAIVRMEAIRLAERKKIVAALPVIEKVINERNDDAILPEAVKAKCMLTPDELENFDEFIEDKDHRLMKAAITGLITSGGISAVVTAGQKLLLLIASNSAEERKTGAEIIGELAVSSFYKPLLQLLNDEDEEVVKAAIQAAGKVKNEKLIDYLVYNFFIHGRYERLVVHAMYESGNISLNVIRHVLTHKRLSRRQQSKLILLCGRIGTEDATKLLDELVWKLLPLHSDIFHALHLCVYTSVSPHREQHIDLINQYLNSATRILFMIKELQEVGSAKELCNALQLELKEIRDSILMLFSFVYDKEKMLKAKNAFLVNKKENIANALEMIEIEIPKEISLRFAKTFEPGTVSEKCADLKIYFNELIHYALIIDEILNDKYYQFHRWTKATALYSLAHYKGQEKIKWFEKVMKENDTLLTEIAQRALQQV
jgi:AAA family ATP:ADP antiporter